MKKRQILFLFICITILFSSQKGLFAQNCTPSSTQQEAWISLVQSRDFLQSPSLLYENPSGASAYSDFTGNCMPVNYDSTSQQINITVNREELFIGVWVDVNNDGDFDDPGEERINIQDTGSPGIGTNLNGLNLTGGHLLRIIVSDQPITGPCDPVVNGEIEDYILCGGEECPWISRVRLFDNSYVNESEASDGNYADYKDPCIPVFESTFNQINVHLSQDNVYRALYIDINGNGDFSDPGEQFVNGQGDGFGLGLSGQINDGTIQGGEMVRVIVSSEPITDPNAIPACGEVEDYTLCGGKECPWISKVRLFDNSYVNESEASDGNYSDYKDPCIPILESTFNQINVHLSQDDVFRALYIDLNGDGDFSDPGEQFVNGQGNGFGLGLSAQINSGIIEGGEMVRVIVSSDPITDPNAIPECGEVEDYTLCGKPNCENIEVSISNIQCYNQGTSDPNDDYWTFEITVTDLSGDGTFWRAGDPVGEAGSYGTKTIWMDGAIVDYDDTITFDVYDDADPDCVYTVTVDTPEPCSAPCELDISYEIGKCEGNDEYFVTLNVTGTNGQPWMAKQKLESDGSETVLFNGTGDMSNVQLGPLDINDGDWTLWVQIVGYYDCLIDVYINAPEACEDECNCSATLQPIQASQARGCVYLVAAASVGGCDGDQFSESYTIDYGDGSPIETTNSNGGFHEYPGSGTYTVTMTYTVTNLETGCETTTSRTDPVTINCEGGEPGKPRFNAYPNPSKDVVNFEVTTTSKEAVTIQVYNIYGREVYTYNGTANNQRLIDSVWDARKLQSGIYIAILTIGDTKIHKKIIIE